jgi:threonine dehydrogenase-like Zn-dependent dehydrogenase
VQGAVFAGDRRVELCEFEDPRPGPDEVVVAIRASGMCGSDLHDYRAPSKDVSTSELPIGGHEPAGVVHAVGSAVPRLMATEGMRVMVHHYAGCTACEQCRSGWPQMCTRTEVRVFGGNHHGGHAPFLRVPAAALVPLDDALSFEAGAAIACGTGTAWGGLRRLGEVGGATLVVFGQGPVGLSATMLAAARGARVIAVDPAPARLRRSLSFGAAEAVDPATTDPVAAIRELTRGHGAELALETSGSSQAAASSLTCLAPWGKVCFVGLGGRVEFAVRDYLRSQMTLLTSWTMSIVDQKRCGDFVVEHQLPVEELFTHRWRLDQVAEAYQEFDKQSSGKGVIVF